ncbi:S8 family serine peptidase [Candidatus Sumerlaeota bacterium]|nr:S8 family serine peptidase [Candidatus Sumerlaeota bacterium]
MKRISSRQLMMVAGLLVGAGLGLVSPTTAGAQGGTAKVAARMPTVPAVPVYYYNGDSRVDLFLALDELHVKDSGLAKGTVITNTSAEADALDAGLKSIATNAGGDGNEYYLLVDPNPNLTSLEENASALRALKARGRTVRAVAYAQEDSARDLSDKRIITNEFAVKLTGGQDINALAKKYGATVVEKVGYSADTYILGTSEEQLLSALNAANAIKENEPGIAFSEPQIARQQTKRFLPNDTLFPTQWHLRNTAQTSGGVAGNDVNIEGAWDSVTGAGVNIAITDDGVQVNHPDLSANCRTDIDKDLFSNDNDPSPVVANGDGHGNSCAGVAAAKGNNALGVTGAAYNAGIVGVRLTAGATTDSQEAQAMGWQATPGIAADRVSINSNSWGPSDSGALTETFGSLTKAAFENGITNGRGGKGIIYTWAAGNGRCNNDNIGHDGYASSRYVIAVGASGANGNFSYYSEPGASMVINAPSNYGSCGVGPTAGITTTDLTGTNGYNGASSASGGDYTNNTAAIGFGGTSSATPLVAGCVALLLEANPNLTWRDVKGILISTATRNNPADPGWAINGGGRFFNHSYGFGRINAAAAVAAATSWTNYGPENVLQYSATPNVAIPDNDSTGVSSTINFNAPPNFVVEHVEVIFNATHSYRGDLQLVLQSPSGFNSTLATRHGDGADNFSNWVFSSIAHWGENPNGAWRLNVSDMAAIDTGTFNSWQLKVYGHLIDANGPASIAHLASTTNDFSGWEMQGVGIFAVLPQAAGGTSYPSLPATGGNVGSFPGFTTVPALDFPTANAGTADPFDVIPGVNRFTPAGTSSITMNGGTNAQGFVRFARTISTNIAANQLLRFRIHLESPNTAASSKDDFKFGMGTLKTGITNEFYSPFSARLFADRQDPVGQEDKFFNPVPAPGSDFDSYLIVEADDTLLPVFVDLQFSDATDANTSNDLKLTSWSVDSFDIGTARENLSGKQVVLNRGSASLPPLDAGEILLPEPGPSSFTFGTTTSGEADGQVSGVGMVDNASLSQQMLSLTGTADALTYNLNGPLVPGGAWSFYPDYRAFSFYTNPLWTDLDHPSGGHFRAENNKLYIVDVWASTTTPNSMNIPQLRINSIFGFLDFNITNHFIQDFGIYNEGSAIGTSPRAYSAVNVAQLGPAFASVPAFLNVEFLQPSLGRMDTLANVTIHRITVTKYNAL